MSNDYNDCWMDEANARLGSQPEHVKSWVEEWEGRLRQEKEKFREASLRVIGFSPDREEDEGAGCSEWSTDIKQHPHFGSKRVKVLDVPLTPDKREARQIVSRQMQEFGDELMAAWEERYGGG